MSSRSEAKYFRYVRSGSVAANEPLSTGIYRTLADNALHLADSCGRVLINTEFASGLFVTAVSAAGEYYKLASFGPFRLTVDERGIAYPIRVRVAGAKDGKGTDNVSFRVSVSPVGAPLVFSDSSTYLTTSSTNSTTSSWLTSSPYVISLNATQTARCAVNESTSNDGTTRTSVTTYRAMITIHAKRDSGSLSDAELRGLYAAEFVGA